MAALEDDGERSCELARWLVEAGRRRRVDRRPADAPAGCLPDASTQRTRSRLPRLLLFGVLAAACLQYAYLDALLEVVSLRQLIVFVLAGAHG